MSDAHPFDPNATQPLSTPARPETASSATRHYWQDDVSEQKALARQTLEALRTYRAAEVAMRRRTREAMSMAEDEMLALRFLLRRPDRAARPAELSHYLGIPAAATNDLVDKLEQDGRVERIVGFAINRSASIRATDTADAEVRNTLNGMHLRMYAAAMKLTPTQHRHVAGFLASMTEAIDSVDAR
ncbi:MAG TPA: MarR family transcriptional regulator [Microbacterium sp.]|nr:MarR family transcriptional regulator [Microbacterium sp.]